MTQQEIDFLGVLSRILFKSFIDRKPPLPKTALEFCNLLVNCDSENLKNEDILELFTLVCELQIETPIHNLVKTETPYKDRVVENSEAKFLYYYYLKLIYLCMNCVFKKSGF